MRFTDEPASSGTNICNTLQIFSAKVTGLGSEGAYSGHLMCSVWLLFATPLTIGAILSLIAKGITVKPSPKRFVPFLTCHFVCFFFLFFGRLFVSCCASPKGH